MVFESFLEAWECGVLSPIFLIAAIPTIIIELLLLWKCRRAFVKWILPILAAIGLIASDIGLRIITGWDALLPLFGYGIFFWNLAAALLIILIFTIIRRRKSSQEK